MYQVIFEFFLCILCAFTQSVTSQCANGTSNKARDIAEIGFPSTAEDGVHYKCIYMHVTSTLTQVRPAGDRFYEYVHRRLDGVNAAEGVLHLTCIVLTPGLNTKAKEYGLNYLRPGDFSSDQRFLEFPQEHSFYITNTSTEYYTYPSCPLRNDEKCICFCNNTEDCWDRACTIVKNDTNGVQLLNRCNHPYQYCYTKNGHDYECRCSFSNPKSEGSCGKGVLNCSMPCPDKTDSCSSNPCKNGGTCHSSGSKRCTCPVGYLEDDCSRRDPCVTSNTCLNGATCKDAGGTAIKCICQEGYDGINCEFVDLCKIKFVCTKHPRAPNEMCKPCSNNRPCRKTSNIPSKSNIYYDYSCDCGQRFGGDECEIRKGKIDFHFPDKLKTGQYGLFIIAYLVQNEGDDLEIKLDLGNGFSFDLKPINFLRHPSSDASGDAALDQDAKASLDKLYPSRDVKYFAFQHHYSVGEYFVNTEYSNGNAQKRTPPSTSIKKITVEGVGCLPVVELLNCAHNMKLEIPKYRSATRFVIPASIYPGKLCTASDVFTYKWNLYELEPDFPFPIKGNWKSLENIAGLQQNTLKYVVFPPRQPPQGRYYLEIYVSVVGQDHGVVDFCIFDVEEGPPTAFIKGGAIRTIDPKQGIVELNATNSYDESDPTKSSFLTYKWTSIPSPKTPGGIICPGTTSPASLCDKSLITIDPAVMARESKNYVFRVEVTNSRSKKTAIAEQKLVFEDNSIEIDIVCLNRDKTCEADGKWCRNAKLLFHCTCPACSGGSNFEYEYELDSTLESVSFPGEGLFRVQLREEDSNLNELSFKCKVEDKSTGKTGEASFLIPLTTTTVKGSCSVDPLNGTFLVSEFTVICTGFQSLHDPLVYIVYARPKGSDLGLLADKGLLMAYDTNSEFTKLSFPLGVDSENWTVSIEIEIVDSFGNTVKAQPIEVQVTKGIFTDDTIPEQILNTNQDGLGGVLLKRLEAGDNQRALQLMINLLQFGLENSLDWEKHASKSIDVIAKALLEIPLHSELIVLQVNQALHQLVQFTNTSDEALRVSSQILFNITKSSRHYVKAHEEVIRMEDLSSFARCAKDSARHIMVEGISRGRKKLAAQRLEPSFKETNVEFFLDEPDEVPREYFVDIHEDDNVTDINAFVNNNLEEDIQAFAQLTLKAYQSVETVLDGTAEREVISDRVDFIEKREPELSASVQVLGASEIPGKSFVNANVKFIIPSNSEKYLPGGIAEPIQVEMTETDFQVNPYFDDLNIVIQTPVVSLTLKDENGNLIEFGSDSYIDIFIPFNGVLDKSAQVSSEKVTVKMIPFSKIDQSNTDVKIYHLSLHHGAQFSVEVQSESKKGVQFAVTAVKDFLPEKFHFCSLDSTITQRLSDTRTVANFDAGSLADVGISTEVDFYIGIWPFEEGEIGSYDLTYTVRFSQRNCFVRNEDFEKWDGHLCEIGEFGNSTHIHCRCKHLSIFAGSMLVPPNNLDIVKDIELIFELDRNPIVAITVGVVLLFYLVLLIISIYKDTLDRKEHYGITIMTEIGDDAKSSYYLITAFTGSRPYAGTSANVSIQIYGSNGRSTVYVLKDQTLSVLNKGGIDTFLISSVKDLGELDRIRIWHDNSGTNPGWYLRKIIIRNVKTDVRWYFFVEKWLSVSNEVDPSIIRVISASSAEEAKKWSRRFRDRLVDSFNNAHLWLSVFLRLPSSNFSRAQRLSCAVAILTSYMLINIMFHGIPTTDYSNMIEIGDISVDTLAIVVSIQTTLCALPFGFILVLLFQRIRKRVIPTLIIWKNSAKRRPRPEFHEAHLFLPTNDGKTRHVVPIDARKLEEEEERPFSIPSTDIQDSEKWIAKVTKNMKELPPYHVPSPDAFVRTIGGDTPKDAADKRLNNLLRVGRRSIIAAIREQDPYAFCFKGDNDNKRVEELIDESIMKYADSEHLWTKMSKKDLQRLEIQHLQEIPRFQDPVKVVEVDEDKPRDNSYFGIALELYEMPPLEKKTCYLPWWFVYIAWILCLATILITSALTVLFGLSYGYLKSLHWLSQISLSFVVSLVFMQPLQVFMVALILTFIYRKIHTTDEDRFQVRLLEGDEDIGNPKPLRLKIFRPSRNYPPLTSHETFKLRIKARRRNMLRVGLISILFHVLLMIFLLFIAHSNQSSHSYLMTENLRNMFGLHDDFEDCERCNDKFTKLTTEAEFFHYMTDTFLDIVNPRQRYSGTKFPLLTKIDSLFLKDESAYLIGIPRLRQIRIKGDICQIPQSLKVLLIGTDIETEENRANLNTFPCSGHYQKDAVDTGTYRPSWKPIVGGNRGWESPNDVWKYKTEEETKSIPREGRLGTYEGGGFVAELGRTYQRSASVLYYLKKTDWIDSRTRAIFIEFLIYNANVNLFADVVLTIEKSASQAFRTRSKIQYVRLTFPDEQDDYLIFLIICHVIVSVFLLILIILFIKSLLYHWRHYGAKGLLRFWLWSDLVQIIFTGIALGVSFNHAVLLSQVRKKFENTLINEYISFQELTESAANETAAFAAALSLCIIKFWKLLVFTFKRFYIMSLTLRLTSRFLIGFIGLLAILVTGFAIWGYITFGSRLESFHTIRDSFLELIYQFVNVTFYDDLNSTNRLMGPIYFFMFGFFVVCISLNLFIALLNQGLLESKQVANQRPSWISYWTYIKRFHARIFPPTYKPPPDQKLSIHPYRVLQMKKLTATFIRAVLNTREMRRMSEMRKCTEKYLENTKYSIISVVEKMKRNRAQMSTAKVNESRLEEMRLITIAFIKKAKNTEFTAEDFKPYCKFNMEILKIRLKKLNEKLDLINAKIGTLFEKPVVVEKERFYIRKKKQSEASSPD